ncbi:MAG: FAD/NAD(P)-binding oxidoreductase [Nitriliruptoraceae bacterium]
MARVVVLGGGFGGIAAATRLRERLGPDDEVVLVARDDRFAMGWTKIWDLVGIRPLEEGMRNLSLLATRGIDVRLTEVTAIDAERRTVTTADGELEADALVVALGAVNHPDHTALLDGAFAHDLYSFAALPAAKEALGAFRGGRLVVAVMGQPLKCPPAPFEAILALDELLRARGVRGDAELTIATPSPSALPVAGPEASAVIAHRLAERDIELRTQCVATAIDAPSGHVMFDDGFTVDATLVFGVPAAAVPPVIAASALAGKGGWIHPDPESLETTFDGVYAVGDCTTVPTATAALPKAGVFAAAEGEVAADNIAASSGHGEPRRFDGHGHCYLEFPGREVAEVSGDFYARPAPRVAMSLPSAEAFQRKLDFESARLTAWFGG